MQDRIFYVSSSGFIFGILLASIFPINFYFTILISFISLLTLISFEFFTKNKWGLIISSFFLILSFGILYFNYFDNNQEYKFLENKVGSELEFVGEISTDIIPKENSRDLIVKVKEKENSTKVLVSTSDLASFNYGDIVSVSGKLEKPKNFKNENGKEFDYVNYLKKDGIYYIVRFAKVRVVDEGEGNIILKYLFKIKNNFSEKIAFIIPSFESNLLNGLILGERSSFPEELKENFIKTGTIHIVALSGYNVTIISTWFMKLLSFLPFVYSIFGGVLVIILFVLMTGAYMTSIRAGIMAILVLFARYIGREYDVLRALFFTAILMLLFNPFILYFDVSFQLSFIATVGVIFLTPRVEKYFTFISKRFNMRDIIATTFSAYIFVLPFILYKMGTLSIVALPVNILILPLIPLIMLLGFFTGVISFLYLPLGFILGYISYLLLAYELYIINFFASLPFASVTINNFPLILTILIYLYFIYFLFGSQIKAFFARDFT